MSTVEYLDQNVKPFISSSTDYVLEDIAAYSLLKGLEDQTYTIKIKSPKNKIKIISIKHSKTEETNVFPPFKNDSLFEMKWHQNDILYIALNSFGNNKINREFEKIFPKFIKQKAL